MKLSEYYFKTKTSAQVDGLNRMIKRYRHFKIKHYYIFIPTLKDVWQSFIDLDWMEFLDAIRVVLIFLLLPLQFIIFFIPRIVVRDESVMPTRYVNDIDVKDITFPD